MPEASARRLLGLVLAGGASSRMRRDKAALAYAGKTQLDRACELLARHTAAVFVSVRADQAQEPARARHALIVDSVAGGGPMVGIRSAMAAHPGDAWLVIACDLPFLSDQVLAALLAERRRALAADPGLMATAYRSAHDGLPEPLCSVWEPRAAAALAEYHAGGGHCPRKFLMRHPAHLIDPVDARALDNVNTPEEYAEASRTLDAPAASHPMQLKVQYYALMREQAGRSSETVDSAASTPADLYGELAARHGFTLSRDQLKVAVNGDFADWTLGLRDGDAVVFIPPVAGG